MGALGIFEAIVLMWTNPNDPALAAVEVWASMTNDRTTASLIAAVPVMFSTTRQWTHTGLGTNETWYYWLRPRGWSGIVGPFQPISPTGGVSATTSNSFGDPGGPPSVLTIAAGVITIPPSIRWCALETEGAAATDDLTSILGSVQGVSVTLRANHAARTIIVRHSANIRLAAGDFALDSIYDSLILLPYGSNVLVEQTRISVAP
jgi:hypothetical protein